MANWELLLPAEFEGDVTHYSAPDGEGGLLVRSVQNVEPIIEHNKALKTANDGYTPDRSMRRVATIPLNVRNLILANEGWDPWKPHLYPEKMAALLNNPDWAFLRTADGRIGVSNGKMR